MTNAYYTSPTDVEAGVKVRSTDINTIDSAIDAAFDKLPTENNLKRGTTNYAVDTGTANAYVVSLPHTPSGYVDGLTVRFRAINTNTGASTINVNSLGAKSIRNRSGSALAAGDITVGVPLEIIYSTATGFFHLSENSAVSATAAASSATAAASSASAASSSASAAASSATAAASSASAASTSETNAASSASSASTSASTATTQASNASTSATNAASSATTATTKASEASTSATNAATSASAASTSATNASNSATAAATSETNAASSATAAAASAAKLVGTSTTSLAIGTGSKSFTTQSGKQFNAGQFVLAVSDAAPDTDYMFGQITSYSGTSLTVNVTVTGGSGTKADWTIFVSGARGATGATGPGVPANLTITNPASAATLTIAAGSSLITSGGNSVTLTSTGTTNVTLPTSGTLATTGDVPSVFNTIAVSGQSDVVADSTSDTLTLAAGSGIAITTNASTDTVTIASTVTTGMTLGTPVATTSGTSIDFTGIPSTTRLIVINFNNVSTSGTDNVLIQLGDSGGVETAGYQSTGTKLATGPNVATTASTDGFTFNCGTAIGAAYARFGSVTLCLQDSSDNTWTCNGGYTSPASGYTCLGHGAKALSATLDRVRITTTSGTDTFDNGEINISYI